MGNGFTVFIYSARSERGIVSKYGGRMFWILGNVFTYHTTRIMVSSTLKC